MVRYRNDRGEQLCAIVDGWGDAPGAPAVVLPAAWGRTKETLLPLAATLVATFRAAGEAVTVVRFDGIRRRGESHRDPECRAPGAENLHFTFSQGVRDIHATLEFLERSPRFRPRTSILVTFSVASIEGRRAMASDAHRRLGGWVSAVGSADAQSLTRVISGGVDFFGGVERGVRFGLQEIQGLLVDMDRAGRDALEHGLAFLDDARRDFASIRAPITWIHGRHDAWMDLDRIRHALSFGDTSNRRLLEIPTGHQLRTSQQALETFQLIATEVGRLALGRPLAPCPPDPQEVGRRRQLESRRLVQPGVDLRGFWRDYLVGRNGELGMELVTHAHPYRALMDLQLEALDLKPNHRVLDLGSGVGSFPTQLAQRADCPTGLHVVELDYVLEALLRARNRLSGLASVPGAGPQLRVHLLQGNLDLQAGLQVPLQSGRFDAAIASLVLNYVADPPALLREAFRLIRPGGRLVLSSLRRDADISTICVDTVSELRSGRGREALGADGERRMATSLQHFINDAARLLDLEERGLFRFWDSGELAAMVEQAGFRHVRIESAFGTPPQAWVVTALRP